MPRFHALIEAIPDHHLTFTGLKFLKLEITWPPKDPNDTSFLRAPSQHLITNRMSIQKAAVMCALATKRFPHVVLKSQEEMVFRSDWHLYQRVLVVVVLVVLAPEYAVIARMLADSSPIAMRGLLGSRNGPKIR